MGARGALRWADADRARAALGEPDLACLALLARLPLLPAAVLRQLLGLAGQAGVYGRLDQLLGAGAIVAVKPSLASGRSARLFHPTDLGLAVLAGDYGSDPATLAWALRLRRRDLLALAARLPLRLALYELLGALAEAGPGRPALLSWYCPCHADHARAGGQTPAKLRLPARVELAWGGAGAAAFFLLPDLGTAPLRAWRWALGQWRDYGADLAARGIAPPTLVIGAATRERAAGWRDLLGALGDGPGGWAALPPVRVLVVPLEQADLEELIDRSLAANGRPIAARGGAGAAWPPSSSAWRPPAPNARLPRIVGPPLDTARDAPIGAAPDRIPRLADLGAAALAIAPADWRLLDLLGCHPFLSPADLAALLDWGRAWARHRRNALAELGLVRRVGADELGAFLARDDPSELTAAGLVLLAARQGQPLARAVALNGLAGGGPGCPIGARSRLLQHPAHTRGADAFFVELRRAARATGGDGDLVAWRPAAACKHGRARPDGYGLYCFDGQSWPFFLEYDRATMGRSAYERKFAAYARDHEQGRFARAYGRCPTILIVTTSEAAEGRIAPALGALEAGWAAPPTALLTTEALLAGDERGALGPVWRTAASATRGHWIAQA